MMRHLTSEQLALYKKLHVTTDLQERNEINQKLTELALKEKEKYKNCPFE